MKTEDAPKPFFPKYDPELNAIPGAHYDSPEMTAWMARHEALKIYCAKMERQKETFLAAMAGIDNVKSALATLERTNRNCGAFFYRLLDVRDAIKRAALAWEGVDLHEVSKENYFYE